MPVENQYRVLHRHESPIRNVLRLLCRSTASALSDIQDKNKDNVLSESYPFCLTLSHQRKNFRRQNCWVMTADRAEPLGRKIIFPFPLYGASNMWTASASNPDGTGGGGAWKTRRSPPVFTETPLTSVSHGWPGVKGAGVAGGHGPAPVITATRSSGVSTAAFSQVAGG